MANNLNATLNDLHLKLFDGQAPDPATLEDILNALRSKQVVIYGAWESIPFLVDNAKRPAMSLTPHALAVGRSRQSPAAAPRAGVAGAGSP
jgi:hypothetical protein